MATRCRDATLASANRTTRKTRSATTLLSQADEAPEPYLLGNLRFHDTRHRNAVNHARPVRTRGLRRGADCNHS